MEKLPKGVYTKEFKEEAVKLITEQGLTVPEVARRLSLPKSTITQWVKNKKKGSASSDSVSAEEMENRRLKKENAELRMERDILKNHPKGIRLSL
jgi:transposase-like protein